MVIRGGQSEFHRVSEWVDISRQAMIDSCTKLDHAHDFQEFQSLRETSRALRESLSKKKKALEITRRNMTRPLKPSARRNNVYMMPLLDTLSKRITSRSASSPWKRISSTANKNSRTPNNAIVTCSMTHEERMREMGESVCEQTNMIDNLTAWLDKTATL